MIQLFNILNILIGCIQRFLYQILWSNIDLLGDFTDYYKTNLPEKYYADAYACNSNQLTDKINMWIAEQTDDVISGIAEDMSGASSALLSSLYMETLWINGFPETSTFRNVFTDINGGKNTMEFMELTGEFLYAEKNGVKLLVLPMEDDLSFVYFSDNRIDILDQLSVLETETVHVVLPKFELTSVLDTTELLNFLLTQGVTDAMSMTTANFHPMCDDSVWFLQAVMQSAKLTVTVNSYHTQEHIADTTAGIKEFIADQPFSFAVVSDLNMHDQQMLLYGQVMTSVTE